MERKYYLRGLGIGIAVTAIIMGIALSGNTKMTDEEIIARAKELGMVENTVLSDVDETEVDESVGPDEDANADADGNVPNNVSAPEQSVPEQADAFPEEHADAVSETEEEDQTAPLTEDKTTPDSDDETEEDTETDKPVNTNDAITSAAIKTITVNSGDGSYTVARKLADVGVVISAETFDTFLCQNGYDKKLRPGTFSIPADASDEQIARIVTGAE